MEIYGCTLTEYKEQYKDRLNLYKERFEDRDESVFLEREIINFKDFHNVLVSIYNSFIKNKSYYKLSNDLQFKNHLIYLQNNYNYVYKELFQVGPPLLDANKKVSHPDDIKEEDVRGYIFYFDITKEKLDNFITSAKRILEFINNKIKNPKESNVPENVSGGPITVKPENPHPRIFKNYDAFGLIERLIDEFGNTKINLSNYSFVYHKMKEDKLIFEYVKQIEFFDFLAKYDIHINRIKSIDDIGKKQFRESIYTSAK